MVSFGHGSSTNCFGVSGLLCTMTHQAWCAGAARMTRQGYGSNYVADVAPYYMTRFMLQLRLMGLDPGLPSHSLQSQLII